MSKIEKDIQKALALVSEKHFTEECKKYVLASETFTEMLKKGIASPRGNKVASITSITRSNVKFNINP